MSKIKIAKNQDRRVTENIIGHHNRSHSFTNLGQRESLRSDRVPKGNVERLFKLLSVIKRQTGRKRNNVTKKVRKGRTSTLSLTRPMSLGTTVKKKKVMIF